MDKFTVEILADGTVKSVADAVSPENHQSAEAFFKMLAALTGGPTSRKARGDVAAHHHHGEQSHTHGH